MFADNFLVEHQDSPKHKSISKDQIASINFCELELVLSKSEHRPFSSFWLIANET